MFDATTAPLKQLQEAIDEIATEDLGRVFDDQAEAGVVALHSLIGRLNAEWLRRVGDLHDRGTHEAEGHRSVSSWLAQHCSLAWGSAKSYVFLAGSLDDMPETAAAFAAGHIDLSMVRRLVKARNRNEDLFARDETVLVGAARRLRPRDFARAVEYWCDAADHDASVADAESAYARRHLHVSETFGGTTRLDGNLDSEGGQIVRAALNAHVDSWNRDGADHRTAAQKRADALVDICRDHLDHGDAPQTGGEKPHVSFVVDMDRLASGGTGRSEFDDGTALTREAALRLLCDSSVSRVVTRGASEMLDVGRRVRTATAAQRRALAIRDGGCTWQGCERPVRWCDAHHIEHWALGGRSDLDNLTLLCRRHHRLAHQHPNQHQRIPSGRGP